MAGRARGHGDAIPRSAELMVELERCRKALVAAESEVRPFGPAYHALSMVTRAIDALATFVTGERDHFSIGGSAPRMPPNIAPTRRDPSG